MSAVTRAGPVGVSWPGEERHLEAQAPPSRRGLWRLLAASPLPLLVPLWALWRDVYMLDAAGLQRVGGAEGDRRVGAPVARLGRPRGELLVGEPLDPGPGLHVPRAPPLGRLRRRRRPGRDARLRGAGRQPRRADLGPRRAVLRGGRLRRRAARDRGAHRRGRQGGRGGGMRRRRRRPRRGLGSGAGRRRRGARGHGRAVGARRAGRGLEPGRPRGLHGRLLALARPRLLLRGHGHEGLGRDPRPLPQALPVRGARDGPPPLRRDRGDPARGGRGSRPRRLAAPS